MHVRHFGLHTEACGASTESYALMRYHRLICFTAYADEQLGRPDTRSVCQTPPPAIDGAGLSFIVLSEQVCSRIALLASIHVCGGILLSPAHPTPRESGYVDKGMCTNRRSKCDEIFSGFY